MFDVTLNLYTNCEVHRVCGTKCSRSFGPYQNYHYHNGGFIGAIDSKWVDEYPGRPVFGRKKLSNERCLHCVRILEGVEKCSCHAKVRDCHRCEGVAYDSICSCRANDWCDRCVNDVAELTSMRYSTYRKVGCFCKNVLQLTTGATSYFDESTPYRIGDILQYRNVEIHQFGFVYREMRNVPFVKKFFSLDYRNSLNSTPACYIGESFMREFRDVVKRHMIDTVNKLDSMAEDDKDKDVARSLTRAMMPDSGHSDEFLKAYVAGKLSRIVKRGERTPFGYRNVLDKNSLAMSSDLYDLLERAVVSENAVLQFEAKPMKFYRCRVLTE